jgi:hypothetical protein
MHSWKKKNPLKYSDFAFYFNFDLLFYAPRSRHSFIIDLPTYSLTHSLTHSTSTPTPHSRARCRRMRSSRRLPSLSRSTSASTWTASRSWCTSRGRRCRVCRQAGRCASATRTSPVSAVLYCDSFFLSHSINLALTPSPLTL